MVIYENGGARALREVEFLRLYWDARKIKVFPEAMSVPVHDEQSGGRNAMKSDWIVQI
jgi:hypothetical protein